MTTANFQWPEIAVSQAQKEVTHNDFLNKADAGMGNRIQISVTTTNVIISDAQFNENYYFEFTGAMTGNRDVTFPARNRPAFVKHSCTGGFTITLKAGTGAGDTVALTTGDKRAIMIDGVHNNVEG